MSETASVATNVDAETHVVSASSGVDYAYRATGAADARTLVSLQHFRGNLDNWDPALIDALAGGRRVITFDNRGVAASSGRTPSTIAEMALDAIDFIDALGRRRRRSARVLDRQLRGPGDRAHPPVDRAQGRARLIGSAGSERHARLGPRRDRRRGQARDVGRGVPERLLHRARWRATRPDRRSSAGSTGRERSTATRPPTGRRGSRSTTPSVPGGQPNHALLERVSAIDKPVFVANGDSDPMILPRYSYLLAGLIPDARLKIYPDSAHGFLFQHHAEFAADVDAFLNGASATRPTAVFVVDVGAGEVLVGALAGRSEQRTLGAEYQALLNIPSTRVRPMPSCSSSYSWRSRCRCRSYWLVVLAAALAAARHIAARCSVSASVHMQENSLVRPLLRDACECVRGSAICQRTNAAHR